MILSPHEIAWLVSQRWKDPAQQRIGVAVFLAESNGDTDVIARSVSEDENLGQRDHGLTQVSGRWNGAKLQANPDWRDPAVNMDIARQIFDERKAGGKVGWTAWSVFNSKSYEKFLPDADHALAAPFPPPRRLATEEQLVELYDLVAELSTQLAAVAGLVQNIGRHFAQEE